MYGGPWMSTPHCAGVIAPACYAIIGASLLQGLPAIFPSPDDKVPPFGGCWLICRSGILFHLAAGAHDQRKRHAVLLFDFIGGGGPGIVLLQLFAPAIAQSWRPSGRLRVFGIFQQPDASDIRQVRLRPY